MSPERIGCLFFYLLMTVPTIKADFLIGTGKADITGAAADSGMMSYAESSQISTGINDRQWARAFIIAGNESDQRIAIVVIDAGAMFSNVLTAVTKNLEQEFSGLYGNHNIIITATHTHSAVAGQSHHFLYNMPHGIYDPLNFRVMVNGITDSIRQAHLNLVKGDVYLNSGNLFDASANRSREAFLSNEDAGRLPYDIDPLMQLLRLEQNGKALGAIAWFPTHGVSYKKTNKLLSSDNKGFAAWLFEQYGRKKLASPSFVAAFPQTNAGDMTPNLNLDGTGPGENPEENVRIMGFRQFDKARQLYEASTQQLTGDIKIRHQIIDFPALTIDKTYTDVTSPTSPCEPAMGYSFSAGTEDGRPYWALSWLMGAREGSKEWSFFGETLKKLLVFDNADHECHYPKPVLLPLGYQKGYTFLQHWFPPGNLPPELLNQPWTGNKVTLTLAQIGQLIIAALPFEATIMAGKRLKETLALHTHSSPSNIIIAGYSNDYLSYLTTAEEYDAQHYEGASNLFGRWSLAGLRQTFAKMALSLEDSNYSEPESATSFEDHSRLFAGITLPTIYDSPYFTHAANRVLTAPAERYYPGDKVTADFLCGHPRNGVGIVDSFLLVQQLNPSKQEWQTIAIDDDWNTRFIWLGNNRARIEWQTSNYQSSGIYRLVHKGAYRLPLTINQSDSITLYEVATGPFEITSLYTIARKFKLLYHSLLSSQSSGSSLRFWYAPQAHEPEFHHRYTPTPHQEEHHEQFGWP